MPRNKISDLNDHLYAQLERLSDESLTDEELKKEVERANAMTGIAANILDVAKTTISALKLVDKGHVQKDDFPFLNQIGSPSK